MLPAPFPSCPQKRASRAASTVPAALDPRFRGGDEKRKSDSPTHSPLQSNGDDKMTLPPGRFDYAPINDRPIIKWPNNARVAFWVAPNMEFFEYLPENRPTEPDIPHYSRMDYGNR